jgi:methylmalonyl-CoA mutase cobalamin-binding subunit
MAPGNAVHGKFTLGKIGADEHDVMLTVKRRFAKEKL